MQNNLREKQKNPQELRSKLILLVLFLVSAALIAAGKKVGLRINGFLVYPKGETDFRKILT